MKLVQFTRDMAPFVAGETRVLPDDVAAKLIGAGDAKPRPSVFDGRPDPAQPVHRPARRYLTRKG